MSVAGHRRVRGVFQCGRKGPHWNKTLNLGLPKLNGNQARKTLATVGKEYTAPECW